MRDFTRRAPLFVWPLVFTAAVFGLEHFAFLGNNVLSFALQYLIPFLWMLQVNIWPTVSVNLAALSLLCYAISGSVRRAWMVLPLLWFGGYFWAALLSHQVEFSFSDPSTGSQIVSPINIENRALVVPAGLAPGLASKFDNPIFSREGARQTWKSYHAAGLRLCRRWGSKSYSDAGIEMKSYNRWLCIYSMPSEPPANAVYVSAADNAQLAVSLRNFEVIDGERTLGLEIRGIQPLHWLPKISLGYDPFKRKSVAQFLREPVESEKGIALAFSLRRRNSIISHVVAERELDLFATKQR